MDFLLTRESKYADKNFNPGQELKENYTDLQILVVGAGGLGCEILKNLALCGVKNIFVVDLDTIELSNLNRQFLFRQKDIGKFKAEVACEFIKKRYPDIEIKSSCRKIQEFTDDFFKQFHIIIGGLDNVEARSYINQKVHDLVEFDENGSPLPETVIPFVDGGTEGFRGQAKVIIPYTTSCFDCDTEIINTKRNTYAMCTIAENPRVPEHCIEYAFSIEWKKHHNKPVDKDSIEDVEWIYKTALERAKKYNIEGVTYNNSSYQPKTATGVNNRGVGSTVKTTTTTSNSSRGNTGTGGSGQIVKETTTKVQMGRRSQFQNPVKPITTVSTERKVYDKNNFFKK